MRTVAPEDLKRGDVLTARDRAGRRVKGVTVLSVQRIRGGVRVDYSRTEPALILEAGIMVEVDG